MPVSNYVTCWDFIGQTASHRPFSPIMRHKSLQSVVSTNHAPQITPIGLFHQSCAINHGINHKNIQMGINHSNRYKTHL
ncbi:hypothetical protein Sjap_008756 [Stephania japonica]|uniref:Uncharacterized protein n=1 Tax=Stephania japonica TaxID=461633 RepID=A0AAP0JQ94_9MAGN